ncbi:MAG: type II toxin-antitoxin system VapC family toxin, partial [Sinobacteraceae bacterium]|nr:type II toxin-antitoxin system VapC family toxin [Nevskiaceae bacterium]
ICSYLFRQQPAFLVERLGKAVSNKYRIVVSAITYAEMRYGPIGKKASPKHKRLVDAFVERLDEVLPWDKKAVDCTVLVKQMLSRAGTPIGTNDCAIAGHALAVNATLITHNVREFRRVRGLIHEDWANQEPHESRL